MRVFIVLKVLTLIMVCIVVLGCSQELELRPFSSDGCSLFPDGSIITKNDWCSCCVEHDLAYWRGGTADERETADHKLKECVLHKTGDKILANTMYEGVRLGGSPYFYNWYRWGYGWSYERKYKALNDTEIKQVKALEEIYLASNERTFCDFE